MITISVCVVSYFLLVWLFLRFFHFISMVDQDIDAMKSDRDAK